jgi:3-dehydroquinate dehydratase/shikimate dehydrogenase
LSERIIPRPAFIASLAPRDISDARRLASLVPAKASAIEYRLDLADSPIPASSLLELDSRPAILTLRTAAEGGHFRGDSSEYKRRVSEAYAAGATVDVEHSAGLLEDAAVLPDRERVIVSFHSPFSLPEDWESRLDKMMATPARAVKFVAGAADLLTALRVAQIQQRHRDTAAAVFPMGPASAPGRVLSALFGASLIYGSVDGATAPGQIPLTDLIRIYGADERREISALFGIVGQEVSGSLSPLVHNALFRARELPNLYLPLPLSDFERVKPQELSFDPPFRGFSVTRPWKQAAARTAAPSEDVRATRAANTLVSDRNRWRAENTDVDGIFDPLADHDTGEGRSAVILGAGGVARSAIVAARKIGYEVLIAARKEEAAEALAKEFGVETIGWEGTADAEADLYLNATPLGVRDEDPPFIPDSVLEWKPLVFDCVYRRDGRPTRTIEKARAARCPTVDGLQMFAAQAVRQARLFGVPDATLEEVQSILARGVGA